MSEIPDRSWTSDNPPPLLGVEEKEAESRDRQLSK